MTRRLALCSLAALSTFVTGCGPVRAVVHRPAARRTVAHRTVVPMAVRLEHVPVRRLPWNEPLPHLRKNPFDWRTAPPTACRISFSTALKTALGSYGAPWRVPRIIYVERAGVNGVNANDGNPYCSYIVDFQGTNLGLVFHGNNLIPPKPRYQSVVIVIDGQIGKSEGVIYEFSR